MELRQLQLFNEVAKHKSITKAAEAMHLSQPALSKSIRALEEELGMTLIIRTNKTSDLTDAGRIVLEYYQKIKPHRAKQSAFCPVTVFRFGI